MTPTRLYFKDSKLILLNQLAVYHQTKIDNNNNDNNNGLLAYSLEGWLFYMTN